MTWVFHIENNPVNATMQVWGAEQPQSGSHSVLQPIEFKASKLGARPKPFIDMRDDHAKQMLQALVDACWNHGIRPSGYEDFRKQNDAIGAHLKDMRVIVADKLKVGLDIK